MKIKGQKDSDIQSAALELFTELGFHATTMEQIAKKAAVSKRTLYRRYPNKDELFKVLIESLFDVECNHYQPPCDTVSIESHLAKMLEYNIKTIIKPDFFARIRLIFIEQVTHQTHVNYFEKILSYHCIEMKRWLLQLQQDGLLRHDTSVDEMFESSRYYTL
jgi:TetR/AcrR family transcriptional regulator of autoinduction and epiphytic fitness